MEKKFEADHSAETAASADAPGQTRKPYAQPTLTRYGDMSSLTRIGTSGGEEDFVYGGGPPS